MMSFTDAEIVSLDMFASIMYGYLKPRRVCALAVMVYGS